MIAVLHTWGQQLSLHQHLDCIVLGGGVNKDGQWQNIRGDGKFCFCKSLIESFRAYCEKLKAIVPIQYEQIWQELWNLFLPNPLKSKVCGRIFGRYTHKIAISNHRIKCKWPNVTLGTRIIERRESKKHDTHASGVYQTVFVAYFAQLVCETRYGFE
jgi:hypothetical protein